MELGPSDKYDFLHSAGMRGLVVRSLTRDDAGLYTCDVGTDETRAHVSVHGACCGQLQTWGQGTGRGSGCACVWGTHSLSEARVCSAEPGEIGQALEGMASTRS